MEKINFLYHAADFIGTLGDLPLLSGVEVRIGVPVRPVVPPSGRRCS